MESLNIMIETLGNDWKQKLDYYLKGEEDELDDKSKGCVEDFLMAFLEGVRDNRVSDLQKIEKKIDNELLYKNMSDYVKRLLWVFYAFAPFRSQIVKDPQRARDIITSIFVQNVLRYNPNLLSDFEEYGFENEEVFTNFLNALGSLCGFVVEKNFCRSAIKNFIDAQTGLPQTLCEHVTELIDQNFAVLRQNSIIEKLNQMEGIS